MKKSVFFFASILVTGAAMSQSLSMTAPEAQQHLDDLAKQANVKRAYMCELEGAML